MLLYLVNITYLIDLIYTNSRSFLLNKITPQHTEGRGTHPSFQNMLLDAFVCKDSSNKCNSNTAAVKYSSRTHSVH